MGGIHQRMLRMNLQSENNAGDDRSKGRTLYLDLEQEKCRGRTLSSKRTWRKARVKKEICLWIWNQETMTQFDLESRKNAADELHRFWKNNCSETCSPEIMLRMDLQSEINTADNYGPQNIVMEGRRPEGSRKIIT